jgi:hypothetical protein
MNDRTMTASPVDRDGYVALLTQAEAAVRDAQLGRLIVKRQRAEG